MELKRNYMVLISLVLIIGACTAVVAQAQQDVVAASTTAGSVPIIIEALNPVEALNLPTAAAAAAGVRAPTSKLRRNTPKQAAMALINATQLVLRTADPPAEVKTEVVCGANSLTPTNDVAHCRIVMRFPNGVSSSCSAVKVGSNRLATAGHCVYGKNYGGWITSVDVYCTGGNTCGTSRTTAGTNVITTPRWYQSTTTVPNAWDVAVLRTASALPGTAIPIRQYGGAGTARTRLTGYPGSNPDVNGCSGYNTCTQYSSTDTMQVTTSGMYTSNTMDLCSGNSGGAVIDAGANALVAIVSGESTNGGQCVYNMFAPSVVEQNVNEGTTACTRSTGGASITCLSRLLPA